MAGRRRSADSDTEAEPPALSTVVGYLLRRAHYVYSTYWLTHFRATETPITPMQAGVLVMLHQNPDVTQSELGRRMGIEAPTAFNLVAKLERSGYVERTPNGSDRRAQMLRLTPTGVALLKPINAAIAARDADLMADFSEAERDLLGRMLVRIIMHGNEHLGISQQVIVSGEPNRHASSAAPAEVKPDKAGAPPRRRAAPAR